MNELNNRGVMGTLDEPSANGTLADRVHALRLDNRVGKNRKEGGDAAWLPWILCAMLGFSWLMIGARTYLKPQDKAVDPPPSIGAAKSAADTGTAVALQVKGYIVPASLITVSPIEVSGLVEEIYFKEGDFVQRGTPLAKLDSRPYEIERAEAEAALRLAIARRKEINASPLIDRLESVAKLELNEAKARLRQLKADKERITDLYKRGTISQSEYDKAISDYDSQEARVFRLEEELALVRNRNPRDERLEAAKAEYEQAQARLEKAIWRYENCTIKAPVTGTILSKKAEKGNYVNALANNATLSGGFAEMADLSDLEVDLEIPESKIAQVRVGLRCRVKADAFVETNYDGYVDRVMPQAKRANSVVPVRIKIIIPTTEKNNPRLKPEMSAVVTFEKEISPEWLLRKLCWIPLPL